MTETELRYPRTRIKPAAKKWLKELYEEYEKLGLNRSYTDIASEAILLMPKPTNGNGHNSDPCSDQDPHGASSV